MSVRSIKTSLLALACLSALGLYAEPVLSWAGRAGEGPRATRAAASFSHGSQAHRAIDCARCHSISAARPEVRGFPGHIACTSCHNFAAEFFAKPVAFCGVCHEGRPVSRGQAALFEFPKRGVETDFGIDFSHPSHINPLASPGRGAMMRAVGLAPESSNKCAACHKKAEPAGAAREDMTIETGHQSCFRCHGESPLAAPAMFDCAACHRLGYPRAPRLYGVVREFRHADHDYDIRPKRKSEIQAIKSEDVLCVECHRAAAAASRLDEIRLPDAAQCQQCHNGKIGLPDALPRDVLDRLANR